MVHIIPASSRTIAGQVIVENNEFYNNQNLHFIIVKTSEETVWQLTNIITIVNSNITSNIHKSGNDLMSVTNGVIELSGSVQFMYNSLYENIIKLHTSTLICNSSINV